VLPDQSKGEGGMPGAVAIAISLHGGVPESSPALGDQFIDPKRERLLQTTQNDASPGRIARHRIAERSQLPLRGVLNTGVSDGTKKDIVVRWAA
jgi:hypothetical protein